MKKTIIKDIFTSCYSSVAEHKRLPKRYHKAAYSIMQCRTSALGGHVQACPKQHYSRVWYNSCKHRCCPLCAYTSIERWLAKKKAILIDDRHFHVVFTLPHQLNKLWRYNFKVLAKIFFSCVRSTLFDLLADERFLGALPGVVASLHTWSRTMMLHPHIHCLITGGGVNERDDWIGAKHGYLLPFRVVRKLFAGRFIDAIRNSNNNGELSLPPDMRRQQVDNLLNKLGRIHWNVYLKVAYSHGHGVVIYLSRYIRGGPVSCKRILYDKDHCVRFNYGRDKVRYMQLSHEDFIMRFLMHVPPDNMVCVRNWGLYHHSQKHKLCASLAHTSDRKNDEQDDLTWQQICSRSGDQHPELCPKCGLQLVTIDTIKRLGRFKFPKRYKYSVLDQMAHAA